MHSESSVGKGANHESYSESYMTLVKFYADVCWRMAEYWYGWHIYWLNLMRAR